MDFDTNGPRVAEFVESFCCLTGSYAGEPFVLEDFQREILDDMFMVDENGKRMRTQYLVGLARKNAKTTLLAAISLYALMMDKSDDEPLVLCAAYSREQARLLFEAAKSMVLNSPALSKRCIVRQHFIQCIHNGGMLKPISSEAATAHGLNPSFVVIDELHTFKNNDLIEALVSGSAQRNEPMQVFISTAGASLESELGKLYLRGQESDHYMNGEFVQGVNESKSFGMSWYGPSVDELDDLDYMNPDVWEKYNPMWPLLNHDNFAAMAENTDPISFKRLNLNAWVRAESNWLPVGAFEKLASDEPIPLGSKVVLSGDFAYKRDASAVVITEIETMKQQVVGFWENPDARDTSWRMPMIEIRDRMVELTELYDVVEIALDPFRAAREMEELAEMGLPVVEFNTTTIKMMVAACGRYYSAVVQGELSHYDSEVLSQHLANAHVLESEHGIRITKRNKSSDRKIDAAIAAVIGFDRACFYAEQPEQELFSFSL
jgi:phage terminase large subunit-like protein